MRTKVVRTNAELSWNARMHESKRRWIQHAQDEKSKKE